MTASRRGVSSWRVLPQSIAQIALLTRLTLLCAASLTISCGPGSKPEPSATGTGDDAQRGGDHGAQAKGKGSDKQPRAKKGAGRRGHGKWGGGRGRGGHGGGEGGDEQGEVAVKMDSLAEATIERFYEMSGTLSALRSAQLRPVQSGILKNLLVEEGDRVEAGQLLARLDGRERALMAARDDLSRVNARRELDRLEQIASSQALSREELDKQRFALESALADSKLSRYQAKLNLVRAPFAGVITARNLDIGNLATSGDVLFEIADTSALELELHVPEREATKVAVGATARVELLDASTFEAAVVRRAPVVDPLTGTVKLTLQASTFPPGAVPGAFVRAKILLESRQAVASVPKSAVFELDGRPHVYAVVDGKAQRMQVELGLEGEERVEILDGLDADQAIVIEGAMDITDGMPLRAAGERRRGPAARGDETAAATAGQSSSVASGS